MPQDNLKTGNTTVQQGTTQPVTNPTGETVVTNSPGVSPDPVPAASSTQAPKDMFNPQNSDSPTVFTPTDSSSAPVNQGMQQPESVVSETKTIAPDPIVGMPVAPNMPPVETLNTPLPSPVPQVTTSVQIQPETNKEQSVIGTQTKGGKFKKGFLLLIALLLVGVIGFFAYRFFILSDNKQAEVTLTWWGLWEDQSIVAPLIAEYQTAHPGVTINYVLQSKEDYRERLTNSLAKGEGPDIFRFHNTWVPMFKNELDNVPTSVMSAADYSQTFLPVIVSDMTSGSGFVGVPLGYDALTLYINNTIFAAEGVSQPKTWDDLRDLARRLTKTENGLIVQSGVALGRTENVDHWQEILALMMLQNRANLAQPTNKLAEDALKFFTLFATADKVWDQTLPNSTLFFANGKSAMYFGPSWRYFEIKAINPDLDFKTVPLPQLPKQSGSEPDYSYASYWVEGVWARGENKDAAWEFLKFMTEKSTLEKLYKNASATRGFGEVYPRVDMQTLLSDHPVLGSIVGLAEEAHSWYLASRTFDGPTGINTQINSYYEDAVNSVNDGNDADGALQTAAQGVAQVLKQYGIVK